MRLSLNIENPPSLLAPARMDVFGTCATRTGQPNARAKRPYTPITFRLCGWQAWNDDEAMEARMARLPGSGSFYWPNALRAYQYARRLMRADASVSQIKIETIGGREIARVYR
jgi:hypothetical protein